MSDHHDHPSGDSSGDPRQSLAHHHVSPVAVYVGILAILLVLTIVTWQIAYVDLHPFNATVALGIALLKSIVVILFFMHVKYQTNRIIHIAVVSGWLFLIVMFVFTMMDYQTRHVVQGWLNWLTGA